LPTDDELQAACAVIESRLDAQGVLKRMVMPDEASGWITVQVPWKSGGTEFSPEAAWELGAVAHLTFRDPDGVVVLEGSQISRATAEVDKNRIPTDYYVKLEFKPEGRAAFAEATARLIGQKISICMDEDVLSSPTVQSAVDSDSCVITGLESFEIAKDLANQINSGMLPFALSLENYSVTEPNSFESITAVFKPSAGQIPSYDEYDGAGSVVESQMGELGFAYHHITVDKVGGQIFVSFIPKSGQDPEAAIAALTSQINSGALPFALTLYSYSVPNQ